MNLPFFKKKPTISIPSREYFFALEIDHSNIKSAVWSVINGKTQVIAVGSHSNWDGQSEDNLLTAVDQSLSDASTRLDPSGKISPEKVIFGLPLDWLSQEKIVPEKLKLLRAITQKLSLKAVGFVVTPDAAIRYLQHQEGVPPTAILVGVWSDQLDVTLVRLGKTDGIQAVARSSKIVADVVEGLSRFPRVDIFPSRILLYDSGFDLEDLRQQLLAHPWQAPQTHLKFLHFPKIEALEPDFTIRAIAMAGGTEVARAIGLISDVPEAPPEPQVPASSPQDLGFVAEEDVALTPTPVSTSIVPHSVAPPREDETEDLELAPAAELLPTPPDTSPTAEPTVEYIPFPGTKKSFSFPKLRFSVLPIIFIVIALLGGLFAAYWYLPHATVTLTLVSKSLDSQFDLTVDTTAQTSDPDKGLVPGAYQEVTATSDKSSGTTGTKLVGDKATGTVTIINGTSIPRTFPAGTTISSPSGQSFSFTSDVQVTSASGSADPNSYQPGKAQVNIVASQIGSDSNISAGTQFRVGTYSSLDYVAKNDAAFAGGTSRQVKVVSKDDVAKLRADQLTALKDSAKSQLISQVAGDSELIPDTISFQTVSEDLNHQVDEQADSVTLRLSVKAKGLTFKKSDLSGIITARTQSQIPSGFVNIGEIEHTFALKKSDKTSVVLAIHASGSLLPRIAEKDLINKLVGMSVSSAKTYLSGISGVSHFDISFNVPLPDFLIGLPHSPSQITLQTKSD